MYADNTLGIEQRLGLRVKIEFMRMQRGEAVPAGQRLDQRGFRLASMRVSPARARESSRRRGKSGRDPQSAPNVREHFLERIEVGEVGGFVWLGPEHPDRAGAIQPRRQQPYFPGQPERVERLLP